MELSTATLWLLGGGVLMGFEAMLAPGIGFFFAALGAITVGVALLVGLIEGETSQMTLFFVSTALWALILWKPFRSFHGNKGTGYSDMVGASAIVGDGGLKKGDKGNVRWSGTTMTARLESDCPVESVPAGEEVIIQKVSGGVLVVAPVSNNSSGE